MDARALPRAEIDADVSVGSCAAASSSSRFYPTTLIEATTLICSEPTAFLNPTTLLEPTALVCSEPTALIQSTTLVEPAALVCSEPTAFLDPTTLICSQPTALIHSTTFLDVCSATLRALRAAGVRTTLAGHFAPTHRTSRVGASRLNCAALSGSLAYGAASHAAAPLHATALHRSAAVHGAAGAASYFLSNCQAGATHKDTNGCKSEKSVRSHHFVSSLGKCALGKRITAGRAVRIGHGYRARALRYPRRRFPTSKLSSIARSRRK
jgi:hypothetical protein